MSKEQYDRDEVVGKNRYAQQANKVWWIISNGEKVLVSDDVRSVSGLEVGGHRPPEGKTMGRKS